jgi:hypothetical protein
MRDAILKTMSENDAFAYQDEMIEITKQRLNYYHKEISKLCMSCITSRHYNSEMVAVDIASPEQLYALGDILNIINTIKENI